MAHRVFSNKCPLVFPLFSLPLVAWWPIWPPNMNEHIDISFEKPRRAAVEPNCFPALSCAILDTLAGSLHHSHVLWQLPPKPRCATTRSNHETTQRNRASREGEEEGPKEKSANTRKQAQKKKAQEQRTNVFVTGPKSGACGLEKTKKMKRRRRGKERRGLLGKRDRG